MRYTARRSPSRGAGWVSERLQAQYLTTAYREAATHKQIKLPAWFLCKDIDVGKAGSPSYAFFGLVRPNGTRKPSWRAFAPLR